MTLRLGGVYALERISRDSQRDYSTVVEVLTAFVRENAEPNESSVLGARKGSTLAGMVGFGGLKLPLLEANRPMPADIAAVLDVLGRRKYTGRRHTRISISRVRLTRLQLRGANYDACAFHSCDLTRAFVTESRLVGTSFGGATLVGAVFVRCDMRMADLSWTNARQSDFDHCDLSNASFRRAGLKGADFSWATVRHADFTGADLRNAKGLTAEALRDTKTDADTKYPWDAPGPDDSSDPWVGGN